MRGIHRAVTDMCAKAQSMKTSLTGSAAFTVEPMSASPLHFDSAAQILTRAPEDSTATIVDEYYNNICHNAQIPFNFIIDSETVTRGEMECVLADFYFVMKAKVELIVEISVTKSWNLLLSQIGIVVLKYPRTCRSRNILFLIMVPKNADLPCPKSLGKVGLSARSHTIAGGGICGLVLNT